MFHLSRAVYRAVPSLCLSSSNTPVTWQNTKGCLAWQGPATDLINPPVDGAVQDAAHQQALYISGVDIELPRDEFDVYTSVGFDELDENLPTAIVN